MSFLMALLTADLEQEGSAGRLQQGLPVWRGCGSKANPQGIWTWWMLEVKGRNTEESSHSFLLQLLFLGWGAERFEQELHLFLHCSVSPWGWRCSLLWLKALCFCDCYEGVGITEYRHFLEVLADSGNWRWLISGEFRLLLAAGKEGSRVCRVIYSLGGSSQILPF